MKFLKATLFFAFIATGWPVGVVAPRGAANAERFARRVAWCRRARRNEAGLHLQSQRRSCAHRQPGDQRRPT